MRRLTPASLSLLMFLAVGGLVAAYIGKNLLAKEEEAPAVEITTIPMALADIEPGTSITEAHVGNGRIPADRVEPDMILNERVVIGRVAKRSIKAGSAFRPDLLYPPGVRPPLDVADGARAVTVEVQATSDLIDGLVSPGQYVDVHFTAAVGSDDARMGGGMTMLLFRGVRVLAINGGTGLSRATNSATLELTPKQANVMILAKDRGKITMAYNPDGKGTGVVEVPEEDRATLEQILGLRPLPEPARPFVSEHYGSGSRHVIQWQDGARIEGAAGDAGAGEPRVDAGRGRGIGRPDVTGGNDGRPAGGVSNPDGPSARADRNRGHRG